MRLSNNLALPLLTAAIAMTSGCAAIESIFKAGVWVGVIVVVLVVALAAMMLGLFRR
jgi:uncharacterized membrane protein YkvI